MSLYCGRISFNCRGKPRLRRFCINTIVQWVIHLILQGVSRSRLCGSRKGAVVVPNMNLNTSFVTDDAITSQGFKIGISWRKSDCHRVIHLADDSATGVIQSPRFPKKFRKNSVCEWWIVVRSRLLCQSCRLKLENFIRNQLHPFSLCASLKPSRLPRVNEFAWTSLKSVSRIGNAINLTSQ